MKVITYQAPGAGTTIDLTARQAKQLRAVDAWPRAWNGAEYCQVQHGLHVGTPTYSDDEITALYCVGREG